MNTVMIPLIGFGLAFDVYAIAVSQGAVLGKVKAKSMVLMCLIVCAWQVVSVGLGYLIASFLNIEDMNQEIQYGWSLVSATIFIALGGIKIFLIQRKKAVPEQLAEVDFKKICAIAASTSIYTFFASMACAFVLLNVTFMSLMICITTILLVIIGVYTGYRNGEINHKIYWSGGIFLIAAGVILTVKYLGRIL